MEVFGGKKKCETAYLDMNGRLPCAYKCTEISTNLFYIVTQRICGMICMILLLLSTPFQGLSLLLAIAEDFKLTMENTVV